ncbi:PTS sugar transporter subunit IIA [Algicella marina]|uniref:PTS lactose transporter subunit IIC n=1 Tax=Algicella marina TaxID=2683284 RepID=A0A6P1T5W5_9RHOB|nr:PTS sugar transporter subunit IIA [Algicella marina]QHQ36846.1 PTS lactose transporter subunit IIC [Algicella marina]
MELTDILGSDAVFACVKVQSKKRLFQEIASAASARLRLPEAQLQAALLERENLGPTGVGFGVAIPHARIEQLDHVVGLFFSLESPVEFESVDRKPVDLVFALFAPQSAGAEHLKALAKVSRVLRSESVCAKLRSTKDVAALYAILADTEKSQAA